MLDQKCEQCDIFYAGLCEKYFNDIYTYCFRLTKGQAQLIDIAEECTQNTFLEARKRVEKLMEHPNVKGWLYVTARNLVRNRFRSMYIKRKHEIALDDGSPFLFNQCDELAACLENAYEIDILYKEVLGSLNKDEYELYVYYFRNRVSIQGLAAKYQISSTAMTTRIYRIRKKITKMIRDYFEEM